jgi:putative membrane protein
MIRNFILSAVAVAITVYLLPGAFISNNYIVTLALVTLLLAIVNALIKPIVQAISLPINILTLGLFSLVINGAMIKIVDYILNDFYVNSFWTSVLFGLILSIVNWGLSLFRDGDDD